MALNGRLHQYRGAFLMVLAMLVLWLNHTFLIPLLMGGIFAIVLYPLIRKMSRLRIGVSWKAAFVTAVFAISFLLPLGAILFFGAEEALSKIQQFQESGMDPSKISSSTVLNYLGLKPLIAQLAAIAPVSEYAINQMLTRAMASAGAWTIKLLQDLLSGLPGAMFSTFITLLTVFFLLVDGKRALRFIHENSFFERRETDQVFSMVYALCYSVVVASIAAGAVQAVLIAIACLITATPGAILFALVAFMLSFIPVLGTTPVTFGLTFHALLIHETKSAIVFAVFIFLVPVCENLVRPIVLKGGSSLHPLVGFVAAFGALDVLGFYGVFIGPVIAGLFFAVLPLVARSSRSSEV